ncbi:MAG: fused MFS/spermidine synthase [Gemmatimonadota bacterium]
MILLFTLTLLLSSALLFAVQPMFARLVLPLLGGTPAVWNTCMVFFQAVLLAGYLYAHLSTRWLGVRRQVMVHVVLLALPLVVLPLGIPEGWAPPVERNPIPWLLALLTVVLGLPFFVVSATAPLLQHWLSGTDHPDAGDPYFLYAASNVGSMTALLAYPLVIEPGLRLGQQTAAWSWGYGMLAVLLVGAAAVTLRRPAPAPTSASTPAVAPDRRSEAAPRAGAPSARRSLRWVALAAVPSSLMLGVTTYLTTDVAVVPLLWVVPLALYLLTFILVFARRIRVPHTVMVRALPVGVVALLLTMAIGATDPLIVIMLVHLAAFFILAMVCHGELARDRPAADHLTSFYLWMSLGGVLGGAFNALVAPQLFSTVAEYPIAVVAACLLWPAWLRRPGALGGGRIEVADLAWPAGVLVLGLVLHLGFDRLELVGGRRLQAALTLGLPALMAFLLSRKAVRFALAVGAVYLLGALGATARGSVLERERSFFGVYRVVANVTTTDARAPLVAAVGPPLTRHASTGRTPVAANTIYHGTTVHGRQLVDPDTRLPVRPGLPLTYYHRDGPIGEFIHMVEERGALERIGVVGLGAGGLAAYADAGQAMTFYEIDPLVERLAEDTRYFTYLSAARQRGAEVDVVLGDARLTLAGVPAGTFDLLVLDAFSSDAVPVHLMTLEAVRMYVERLAPGGALAFHISNRYLRLHPVLAAIARELELDSWVVLDGVGNDAGFWWDGREDSLWMVLAPAGLLDLDPASLGQNIVGSVQPSAGVPLWTDSFVDIWSVVDWGG